MRENMRESMMPNAVPNLPEPVRESLPALWDGQGVKAVPSLGFLRSGSTLSAEAFFTPATALAGPAFPVVSAGDGII